MKQNFKRFNGGACLNIRNLNLNTDVVLSSLGITPLHFDKVCFMQSSFLIAYLYAINGRLQSKVIAFKLQTLLYQISICQFDLWLSQYLHTKVLSYSVFIISTGRSGGRL